MRPCRSQFAHSQTTKWRQANYTCEKTSHPIGRNPLKADSLPQATLSENCSLLGTDNVSGRISEHIFESNGGYSLYIKNKEEYHALLTINIQFGLVLGFLFEKHTFRKSSIIFRSTVKTSTILSRIWKKIGQCW